ncbi:histidine acid phosphatase domain containing protein, putative [Eimeria maxima]|uniref:Histidine acid phosphatase domain containing protein, putative n=1 Tax=Eimeria maxima TaxID=5804 RepID=U6M4B9_EIMMA|nr:histidine acid phosphatase domain containing protein, putative [Eimeria maxima]CDJ59037.1 histidine acid phosphatase domain containing protein, putative [Eimeria maxima]
MSFCCWISSALKGFPSRVFLAVLLVSCSRPDTAAAAVSEAAVASLSAATEFPEYCLKEWTVQEKRSLPPLSAAAKALNLELQQVHALVRHGARAPYDRNCWQWGRAADSDLHKSNSRESSSNNNNNTSNSDTNSSTGSAAGHRHVGPAPDQDALRSDAERCPPVGHHRNADCEAAATEYGGPSKGAHAEEGSPLTSAAAAAADAAEESRPTPSSDVSVEDSRGTSDASSNSSGLLINPQDALSGAAAELGPPWECAFQEELGMNDSRSGQLATPSLLKKYVASPTETGLFRGSCVPSSLLDEGQAQLLHIGAIFNQAYVTPASVTHKQQQQAQQQQQQLVHKLFSAEEFGAAPSRRLFVRSTDISRTLASGAFLLEAFFKNSGVPPHRIQVETYEVTSDPLLSGYASPAVSQLRRQAESSPEFAALTAKHHKTKQELQQHLRLSLEELDALWPEVIVDCALTYVCSGRRNLLPPLLQQNNFALVPELQQINDEITNFWTGWADAAAAAAAAHPLFQELAEKILAPIRNNQQLRQKQQGSNSSRAAPAGSSEQSALHLYMTHDVTLIAVLAALKVYGGVWPPYASVVAFEIYEHFPQQQNSSSINNNSSGRKGTNTHVFRLVYNGKVLTARMPGCTGDALLAPDLCSLEVLIRILLTPPPKPPAPEEEHQQQQQLQLEQQQQEGRGEKGQKPQQRAANCHHPEQQQQPHQLQQLQRQEEM